MRSKGYATLAARGGGARRAPAVCVNGGAGSPVKSGTLIVFEGIDGSGKSTQLPRLAARLRAAGHEVLCSGEPWEGCEAGRRIRRMARSGRRVPARTELAWFVEQRRAHLRERVLPALQRGEIVLLNRYYLSSVAYQGARGLDWREILAAHPAPEFPAPDLVLLLDLPPGAGLARVESRAAAAEPAFEERAFLESVREIFLALQLPSLARIAAAAAPAEVEREIARCVARRLALPANTTETAGAADAESAPRYS